MSAPGLTDLLDRLAEVPRENGTPALQATARWLVETLRQSGVETTVFEYVAHPWRLQTLGLGLFAIAVGYAVLLGRGRAMAALVLALCAPVWIVAELELGVPVLGWIRTARQENVIARVPATEQPARSLLILAAHYDTKTDLLDHVERAPLTLVSLPLILVMIAAAAIQMRRRPGQGGRLVRVAQGSALVSGVGLLVTLCGGALVSRRSPGAIDDGAGCAVLVQAARALHERPLTRTDVEVVFFSGEELGVEGSRAWARARFGPGTDRPTRVVNLDGVGESSQLAVFRAEQVLVRTFPPDPALLAVVDASHRARVGAPLHQTLYPATTDARAFVERGIPALNLSSDLPGHALTRGMHSAKDGRHRLREDALDSTLDVLLEIARRTDAAP